MDVQLYYHTISRRFVHPLVGAISKDKIFEELSSGPLRNDQGIKWAVWYLNDLERYPFIKKSVKQSLSSRTLFRVVPMIRGRAACKKIVNFSLLLMEEYRQTRTALLLMMLVYQFFPAMMKRILEYQVFEMHVRLSRRPIDYYLACAILSPVLKTFGQEDYELSLRYFRIARMLGFLDAIVRMDGFADNLSFNYASLPQTITRRAIYIDVMKVMFERGYRTRSHTDRQRDCNRERNGDACRACTIKTVAEEALAACQAYAKKLKSETTLFDILWSLVKNQDFA